MIELIDGVASVAGAMMAVVAIIAIAELLDDEVSSQRNDAAEILEVVEQVVGVKHSIDNNNIAEQPKKVRRSWDHNRAREAVLSDYLGPDPLFKGRQFERVFRVTATIAEQIIQTAGAANPFFRDSFDATGKASISPQVKVLTALKLMAYGVSPSAFIDYFQMGETTALRCMKELAYTLSHSEELRLSYMRPMNRNDAKLATELHKYHHGGIDGMIGSLDCMHVGWRNCPKAWQGQYKGKEDGPTIVLEAFSDYNLWIWHVAFGFAGSLNDLNIWGQSPLLCAFTDGSFERDIDFDFEIAGVGFSQLFLLVDGIYPELGRFVKTLDEAVGVEKGKYASWQESSRKDIERAFGVLQRKFHIIVKPFELAHTTEIKNVVETCIILHNMMVSVRVSCDEVEEVDRYEWKLQDADDGGAEEEYEGAEDRSDEFVKRHAAEIDIQYRQEMAYYSGDGVNVNGAELESRRNLRHYSLRLEAANLRWHDLHNKDEHHKLRNAIMSHLNKTKLCE